MSVSARPRNRRDDVPGAETAQLPAWVRVADVLAIALLIFAVGLLLYGGGSFRIAGAHVSIKSAWRPAVWAGIVICLRHLKVRRLPLHRRVLGGLQSIIHAPEPVHQDVLFGTGARSAVVAPAARRRRAALMAVGVLGLYAALTLVMTYPQVTVIDRGVSVDIGDPLLSTWRLAWIAHQLPRDPLHLFDANIFYPERYTLAYSDSMLVPALTAAPFVWLGMHPLLACNLLLLSGFAFSGAAMFLLVWSLTRHVPAALLAGFVFAFLPYRFMHYAHLELQMAQWMPLCLWALHRTLARGRIRDGLLTGLFLALQTLSSWYYGIFLATYLVPLGLVLFLGESRKTILRSVGPLAAGAVLAAILVLPFAVPYFQARHTVGERPVEETMFYSATPINYLAAHPRNTLLGAETSSWGSQERELFQGIAVPLIALIGLWPPLSRARLGYAIAMALAFEISLGFNGVVFPWLHDHVLPYRGLRVPARMAILVGLSLAIFVGYGVARICTRPSGRRAAGFAFGLLLLLVFAEYHSTLVLKNVWSRPPAIYDQLRGHPDSVAVNFPLVAPDVALEPIYMYFSTFAWHKLLNGYSGFSPPWYQSMVDHMKAFPDDATIDELHQHAVDFVIVHGGLYREGDYRKLMSRIARRDDLVLLAHEKWEGSETRLYRLLKEPDVSRR
jgi:hypothetical protein